MKPLLSVLVVSLALASLANRSEAAVYNLHLVTDKVPDYTDMPSLAHSTADLWQTPQDKAIAVWRWGRRSRRQTSCAGEDGRLIWDPILHYNSYGAMNCGIISSLNLASWLELGFRARYIQLGDHTVSAVSWDDGKSWHLFDSSMSAFCYNHEGVVASCAEIASAAACELSGGKSERGHFYYYHTTPQCMSHLGPTGWRFAGDNPVEFNRTLYEGADSYMHNFQVETYCQHARTGHRYVLGVRPYESYTRYWEPLDRPRPRVRGAPAGPLAASDPDYFRTVSKGFPDPDAPVGPMNIRGNGRWVFQPDFAAKDWRETLYDDSGLAADGGGPKLHPAQAGHPAFAVFKISAANVITSLRIEAEGLRRTGADVLKISVSRNAGMRWAPVWQAEKPGPQAIRLKLHDEVAGVTQCLVKIEMLATVDKLAAGLDALKVTTFTQLNRRTLPKLALGGNQVMLWADEQLETTEVWPPLHDGQYKQTAAAEDDAWSAKEPDGFGVSTLAPGVDGKECSVTWKLAVPSEIHDVFYSVVSTTRTAQHYVSLQHSWDGKRFREFDHNAREFTFPVDKQVQHAIAGGDVPAGAREAWFRSAFFCQGGAASWKAPGIQNLIFRVHHKPRNAAFQPVEVTYHWTEHRASGDVPRTHTERVDALPHRWTINVAGRRDPTMEWVRINLQGHAPEPAARYGYSDGQDVGPGDAAPKIAYRWGKELAQGKSYTASRPSSKAFGNPDSDGRELTNGIVIAPTSNMTTKAVQPATAFWDAGEPVTFVVDLGAAQTVGGLRAWTHQPNARYCHPKSIDVAVSTDGRSWQTAGTIRHDDLWKPPGDFEAWEHDDDPRYAALPAGGRLAYGYLLPLKQAATARYVRLVCTPLEGKGMGLSEFQVFDAVSVLPWPGEAALPAIQ